MDNSLEIPFYAKVALIFISAFALGLILYVGQYIIVPVLCASMIAILLNPRANYRSRKIVKDQIMIHPQ